MVRPILPKTERQQSPNILAQASDAPSDEGRVAKRRCISSACIPCRKRKSKCDGALPGCSTCSAVYQMDCRYDADNDRRRKSTLKRETEYLKEKTSTYETTIQRIRNAPEEDVPVLVEHIRVSGSLHNLPETIGKKPGMNEGGCNDGMLEVDATGNLRHFGPRASLSAIHVPPRRIVTPKAPSQLRDRSWTRVTKDTAFINELLDLYFTWHHPVHVLVSRECFYNDFHRMRSKYCSSLLVNAMLAMACHYSQKPEVRSDLREPSTCGDHFFNEAKALLLDEEETPSITVAQALGIMSLREAGRGRDSSGWMYMGRAIQVALDLGLGVPVTQSGVGGPLSGSVVEVRKITIRGLYQIDKLWCMQFGRLPLLPSAMIGVPELALFPPLESEPWPANSAHKAPAHTYEISNLSFKLTEILEDILRACASPKAPPPTNHKLNGFHDRLLKWREQLPPFMEPHERSNPPMLILHMFYYSIILHVFRPTLSTSSPNTPDHQRHHAICKSAANHLSNIFFQYQSLHYDLHPISSVVNMVLSAALFYLEDLPSGSWHFEQCIAELRKLGYTWEVANQALRALSKHAEAAYGETLPQRVAALLGDGLALAIKNDTQRNVSLDSGCGTDLELDPAEAASLFGATPTPAPLPVDVDADVAAAVNMAVTVDVDVATIPRTFLKEEMAMTGASAYESCQDIMKTLGVNTSPGGGLAPLDQEWLKSMEAAQSIEDSKFANSMIDLLAGGDGGGELSLGTPVSMVDAAMPVALPTMTEELEATWK